MRHETQFCNKFGAKMSLPYPFFLECLQPIIPTAMCTIAINVLDLCAFNPKFQYFIPLFNKISWLCKHQPRIDETSDEGAIQAQQSMTFRITLLGLAPHKVRDCCIWSKVCNFYLIETIFILWEPILLMDVFTLRKRFYQWFFLVTWLCLPICITTMKKTIIGYFDHFHKNI
jgi:hypothetical protein